MRAAAAEVANSHVVSQLVVLVRAAGKLDALNSKHKPPQGPRGGGSRGREVSNITCDACTLQISACLKGLCTLHIYSM